MATAAIRERRPEKRPTGTRACRPRSAPCRPHVPGTPGRPHGPRCPAPRRRPTDPGPGLARGRSRSTSSAPCNRECEGKDRSEEHTSELQSLAYLVCRLLLEKKKKIKNSDTLRTSEESLCPSTSISPFNF